MGTASTMNSLAEALGMSLPGCAAIPAPHKERAQIAYETGKRIVEMVWEDLRPSKIMTREAFENVIVVNSAIGGSTNAPIHFNAIARHIGVKLDNDDWEKIGYDIPLLVNMQPAGHYLGEEYHRAGGVPAVVNELMKAGKIHKNALTVNGKTMGENCKGAADPGRRRHPALHASRSRSKAGFLNLKGNLFDSAIMKTSVISEEFRKRYLSNPQGPQRLRGPRHRVRRAGGLPQAHRRSRAQDRRDLPAVHARRRTDRLSGRRRGREHAAARCLIKKGITELPCIGDGRQSGTSGSPSILNASPEAATGGGLAILKTGDRVRIDLNKRTADILISQGGVRRAAAQALQGPRRLPVFRRTRRRGRRSSAGWSTSSSNGMVLKPAVKYQRIATSKGIPRDNH